MPAWVGRQGSMLCPCFSSEPVTSFELVMRTDRERWKRFSHSMLERVVLLPPSPFEAWFVSSAHTEEILGRVVEAAGQALRSI